MHAWLAFVGGICAVLGVLLLISAFSGVTYYGVGAQLQIAVAVIAFVIAAIVAWMLYAVVRAQYRRIKTGIEALIGAKGLSATDLNPHGTIRVVGEFWEATTAKGARSIVKGEEVEVVGLEGMFVVVKPAEEKA